MAVKSAKSKSASVDDNSKTTPTEDETAETQAEDSTQESVEVVAPPEGDLKGQLATQQAQIDLLTKMVMDNIPAGGTVNIPAPPLTQSPLATQGTKLPYDVSVLARDMPMRKVKTGVEGEEKEEMVSAHFVLIGDVGGRKVIIENVEGIFNNGKIVRKEGSGKHIDFVGGEYDTCSTSVAKYLVDHPMYGTWWMADPDDLGGYWTTLGYTKSHTVVITEMVMGKVESDREPLEFARQG